MFSERVMEKGPDSREAAVGASLWRLHFAGRGQRLTERSQAVQ